MQTDIMASGMWETVSAYFRSQDFEDPELETWLFHSMLDGIYMNYVFNPDSFPINRMKDLIINRYCKP